MAIEATRGEKDIDSFKLDKEKVTVTILNAIPYDSQYQIYSNSSSKQKKMLYYRK